MSGEVEPEKDEVYEGEEIRLSIMIGGEAGTGIVSAGEILARAFAKCTLHVSAYSEVPSLIRGGHNTFQICVSTHKVHSLWRGLDFLIALDRLSIDLNALYISDAGAIVYDSDTVEVDPKELGHNILGREDLTMLPVPLKTIAGEHGKAELMRNTVALGVAIALADYKCEPLEEVLKEHFSAKGEKIVKMNLDSARAGYEYVKEHYPDVHIMGLEGAVCGTPHMVMTGNQAIALGALKAGMTFYSGYPMTPASPLLHWFATMEEEMGIVAKQTEDEISAIMMAIGASSAGARAMTGTSGGGFCLMTEALGLAGEAEIPLVVMLGQRPGPATGLATRTEQADLLFAINASQGEFPRVVLTPGDIRECFHLTFEAFNLADRFQVPVIVMGDRVLNEGVHCATSFDMEGMEVDRGRLLSGEEVEPFMEDGNFMRYAITNDGVSPRVRFGEPGVVQTHSGNEHNEYGDTYEGRRNRRAMMGKRMHKMGDLTRAVPGPKLYGPRDAEVTLVGWGSTKMAAREALSMLEKEGHDSVSYLHFPSVWPLDGARAGAILRKRRRVVGVETNFTGQFCDLLASKTGIIIEERILKYDGRPMTPNHIIRALRGVMDW
jgi:2-oxoglutarate ferredoxin oxidoreductase subunit alpha